MSNSFSIRKKNIEEKYDITVEKVKKVDKNDIQGKLYEQNNVLNKLDFNVELLNKHFVKCIENYLQSKYSLDISHSEKYLSENCKKHLIIDINKQKEYLKHNNVKIKILNIDLIYQNMQSVNYISDLLMNIKSEVSYTKENIYTNCFTDIIEKFTQDIWFRNIDKGWYIEECKPKKVLYYNDENSYYK